MKIYGWYELNECSHTLSSVEMSDEDFKECMVDGDAELLKMPFYTDGRWFATYGAAKFAFIEQLEREIDWRKTAIKSMKACRKKDIV